MIFSSLPNRLRLRILAGALAITQVLVVSAPVCGGLADVDPVACCERHGCWHSSPGFQTGSKTRPGEQRVACNDQPCSRTGSPEDCCRQGALTYPVAHVRSSATSFALRVISLPPVQAALSLSAAGGIRTYYDNPSPPLPLVPADWYTQ